MTANAPPLLEVRNVSVHFPVRSAGRRARLHALDDVSLSVFEGDVLGIVGESGCGKSTLGRTMIGLQRPTDGQITVAGEPLRTDARRGAEAYRLGLQMVFQDPVGSLNPRMTVGAAVTEPLRNRGLSRAARWRRAAQLLDDVGLPSSYLSRYPEELSGGQQQRVAIARALASEPRLIVFDEAVSALDVSTQAQVLNLLKDLHEAHRLTYVFISHDISVIRFISTRVAVMYMGKVMELADAEAIGADALHPYSICLSSAVPVADPQVEATRTQIQLSGSPPSPIDPPAGCRFVTRCPVADPAVCALQPPPLVEHRPGRWAACHFAGEFHARYAAGRPGATVGDPEARKGPGPC